MSETSIGSGPTGQGTQSRSLVEQGSEMTDKGKRQMRDQIDQRTTQAGGEVKTFADALRRTGTQMESQSANESVTRVVSGVADRLERVGGYLEGAKGDDLLRDAERFARERPWVVAGAAAAVGFAASRLLKASSENRYSHSNGGSLRGQGWEQGRYDTGRSEADWTDRQDTVVGASSGR